MPDQGLRRQILHLAALPRAERVRLLKKLTRRQSRYIRYLLLALGKELKVQPDRFEEVARTCLEEEQSEIPSGGDPEAVDLPVLDLAGGDWLETLPDAWIAALLHVLGREAADAAIQSLSPIRQESVRVQLKTLDRPFPEKLRHALVASVPGNAPQHMAQDGRAKG